MGSRSVDNPDGGAAGVLRRRFVESPGSLGARARASRWGLFLDRFPDASSMHVLDLGGTAATWASAPVRPAAVTVVNLFEPGEPLDDTMTCVTGDACSARDVLAAAGLPAAYDLVFSNSLLEHVGGHARRLELAAQVRAAAPRYWVQTPYRYFPVEPHWLFPGMQHMPLAVRTLVARRWPLQHTRPASTDAARAEVQWTELVCRMGMRGYFPDAQIIGERFAGLTKSLIAVRG